MIINVTEEEYISQEPEVHFINISVNVVDYFVVYNVLILLHLL